MILYANTRMKLKTEYIILILVYIFVLAVLYGYKKQMEGFNNVTDFLKSNDFIAITSITIFVALFVYALYKLL